MDRKQSSTRTDGAGRALQSWLPSPLPWGKERRRQVERRPCCAALTAVVQTVGYYMGWKPCCLRHYRTTLASVPTGCRTERRNTILRAPPPTGAPQAGGQMLAQISCRLLCARPAAQRKASLRGCHLDCRAGNNQEQRQRAGLRMHSEQRKGNQWVRFGVRPASYRRGLTAA